MGVDLRLLIVEGAHSRWAYAHTLLEFGREYEVFDELNNKARTLPEMELHSYLGEEGYGPMTKTPYGDAITFVTAQEFLTCMAGREVGPMARECLGYIREMRPDAIIGLYYH